MNGSESFYRDTWATIDLDALNDNIKQTIQQVGPDTEVMAVVKANAYGHGYLPVARAALKAGATQLAVAFLDEAIYLRKAGFDEPILVLGASRPEDAQLAAEYNIQLTVFSAQWIEQAAGGLKSGKTLFIHVKCDTGMGRIGVRDVRELQRMERLIQSYESLELRGIYTHFATADEKNRAYTNEQLERFMMFLEVLKDLPPVIHASNSAGLLLRGDARFSLVRLGISMYGLSPSDEIEEDLPFPLKPVMSLHTKIVHCKKLQPNESISYGATYTTTGEEWIATLPIGYADGWLRGMQGYSVLVDGHEAEIVGRVCMDQCMIRLPYEIPVGATVTLIGNNGNYTSSAAKIARHMSTISYEVTCAIAARIPRLYRENGEIVKIDNHLITE